MKKKLLIFSLLLLHINAMAQSIEEFLNRQMMAYPENLICSTYTSLASKIIWVLNILCQTAKGREHIS